MKRARRSRFKIFLDRLDQTRHQRDRIDEQQPNHLLMLLFARMLHHEDASSRPPFLRRETIKLIRQSEMSGHPEMTAHFQFYDI